ncbi:IgGFc-binding protein-like [Tiliqua scincoides]|uniref:IgGFc-binding protein-like n=1 Tax=Tiliqua scincoides TaxID=71010 RepID=UPI0034617FD5
MAKTQKSDALKPQLPCTEMVGHESLPPVRPQPNPCSGMPCGKGYLCVMKHNQPECVPEPCKSIKCQEGTLCEIVQGLPSCVSHPSCHHVQCICNIVNGWPKCISVPGSCERSHCPHGTVCQVVDGRPKCVPATQSCQTVQCSQGTVCKVVSGSPVCVPLVPTHSVCWASGQPHYHTFDGHSYDFQGTCTYTVVKTCKPHSTLPFFHIFTRTQKNGSSPFSSVSQVTVAVYNSTITMVKYEYGLVRVNQLLSRLPIILHDGKLSLHHRGGQLEIETQFGLKVYYDWNHYLAVKVTPAFRNQVCGLCGNYNGDPNDDIITSLGGLVTDLVEFGKSWTVETGDGACSHGCHGKCRCCSPELIAKYRKETFCGLIGKHRGGPFHHCHSLIDPKPYLDDCVADFCAFEGYKQILCRALKTYADACQREGATVSDWRKHAGCPQFCPENSRYMACGSACPATCNDLNAPEKCHLPCIETCQCKLGYVLDGGKCIPKDSCGCNYHGQLYEPNQQFWGDQQCHQQCVCRPHDKQVVCQTSRCRPMEGCHVVNGIRNCYPTTYGTCSVQGQLHYTSFDGLRYDFYGNCVYRLTELCHERSNLTQFQVLVQDEKSGPRDSSASKVVEVKVYGVTVIISHNRILLDSLLINLPFYIDNYKILLYRHGWDTVVKADFGLTVAFDGRNNIRVSVPGAYRGRLCGLCGNFNGRASDDMTRPDDVVITSPADFARSWKIRDIPGCTEVANENCIDFINVEREQKKSRECGVLLDQGGPFKMCHGTVSPQWYFKDCAYDYCFNKGNQSVVCHILSSYTTACQAAGAKVYQWRSNQFCRPDCPANSHYEVCASGCPVTCRNLFNPVLCTTKCREGCECNEGYILSGDQCVPISQCGCVHQGFYYKAGESFYANGFCKEWCFCQVGGIVQCQHSSCGPHENCLLVDGVQKCHRMASGRGGACHVAGDPHYLTFDGFTFDLQSNCTYTLVKSCTHTSALPSFVINVENERRTRGKISVTKTVSVTVYEHTITILREKRGIILVNGATLYLPFGLESNGMWVYNHGENVVIRTDFGLFVSFDQLYHLIVMVPESYQGQTCGLCGNYNGNSSDDLFLRNLHPSTTIATFAAGWRVEDPTAACTEDCAAFRCGTCRESRKASHVHASQCGILQAPHGPFSACYSTINPTIFFNNCVHDLCKARGNPVILCRVIHGYVTACQAAGIKVNPWRTQTFCPAKCPVNSHYELCANTCPTDCKEASSIIRCPSNCAEGCQCNRGYFMAGYHCVPVSQCRCFRKGVWFKVGVKTITANCTEECICRRQGQVECRPLPCAAGEMCVLRNAKWSCVRQEGHCTIAHRHTFTSYDGISGNIPPDGSYEISSLIDTKAEHWFRVVGKLHKCSTCWTPAVEAVTVYFHNLTVLVNQNGVVSVNGYLVHLPVQPSKNVSVSLTQEVVTVRYGSQFRVLFGTNGDVTVVISADLANKVFRSCGNFNGNGDDDLLLPNGQVAHTITEVISHWRVTTIAQQGVHI